MFEAELANFRAALNWAASESPKSAFDFVAHLWDYWLTRALAAEGLRWATWVVETRHAVPPTAALDGLQAAAELLRVFGDREAALHLKYELVHTYDRLGDTREMAATLSDISDIRARLGDIEAAREAAARALELRRSVGAPAGIGHGLYAFSVVEFFAGDYRLARRGFEEARAEFERAGWATESAEALFMEAQTARRMGDHEVAKDFFRRSSSLVFEVGRRGALPEFLQEAAALAEDPEDAARLLGAADRLLEEFGVQRWDPADYGLAVAHVKSSLGPGAFVAAHEQGRRSSTEQEALELAMRCLG
jgi:tetratricopeptide (TPR) repeat protein